MTPEELRARLAELPPELQMQFVKEYVRRQEGSGQAGVTRALAGAQERSAGSSPEEVMLPGMSEIGLPRLGSDRASQADVAKAAGIMAALAPVAAGQVGPAALARSLAGGYAGEKVGGSLGRLVAGQRGGQVGSAIGGLVGGLDPSTIPAVAGKLPGAGRYLGPLLGRMLGKEPGFIVRLLSPKMAAGEYTQAEALAILRNMAKAEPGAVMDPSVAEVAQKMLPKGAALPAIAPGPANEITAALRRQGFTPEQIASTLEAFESRGGTVTPSVSRSIAQTVAETVPAAGAALRAATPALGGAAAPALAEAAPAVAGIDKEAAKRQLQLLLKRLVQEESAALPPQGALLEEMGHGVRSMVKP